MVTTISKKIEIIANVMIIVVSVLLAVVLAKDHLLTREPALARPSPSQSVETANQIATGMHLTSLDVDWKQSEQTLVLAISSACHFCTESAPFYKRLVQGKGTTRVVAVFPQPVGDGEEYLKRMGITTDEVRQLGLDSIGVRGTPTLLLVDSSGVVKRAWMGKLNPAQEQAVLGAL